MDEKKYDAELNGTEEENKTDVLPSENISEAQGEESNAADNGEATADEAAEHYDTTISGVGVNYENNDNWEFEAEAPTLADDFLQLDGVDEEAEKPEEKEAPAPVPQSNSNQIVINKEPLKFIPLAIFVAACIAVISVFSVRYFTVPNGKEGKYMNPGSVVATVEDTKVSTGMFNYYYSSIVKYYESYASYFGLDTSSDYSTQYKTDDEGNKVSWSEFFENEVFDEIKYTTVLYSNGLKAGVTLTKDQQETIDDQMETFKTSASESGVSLDEYISSQYGEYCTEDTLRLMLEQYYITINYQGMLSSSQQPTDDEIQKYYSEHENEFKSINFSYLAFNYDTTSDEAKEESQKTVDKYMKKITDRDSIMDLVPEVYSDYIESDTKSIMESDSSLTEAQAKKKATENYESSVDYSIEGSSQTPFDAETTEWLFSDSTKVGEKKCYINESAGYAYLVLKTEMATADETETYSVRHILIMPRDEEGNTDTTGEKTFTDEQWEEAEKKAKEVYETFNKGDKTEYSFALLAEQYSDDTASLSSSGTTGVFGGLCEAIPVTENYVAEFKNWCIDDSRRYGDTDIVKSQYGYHIMFFVNDTEAYKASVISAIKENSLEKLVKDAEQTLNRKRIDKAISIYNASKSSASESADSALQSAE
ncbi:MAG: peptidylprolyl isomerase [Eubacterium sp.]